MMVVRSTKSSRWNNWCGRGRQKVAGLKQTGKVIGGAVQTIDERYADYRIDVTTALQQVLRAQGDASSDAARARDIEKIVQALGEKLRKGSELS